MFTQSSTRTEGYKEPLSFGRKWQGTHAVYAQYICFFILTAYKFLGYLLSYMFSVFIQMTVFNHVKFLTSKWHGHKLLWFKMCCTGKVSHFFQDVISKYPDISLWLVFFFLALQLYTFDCHCVLFYILSVRRFQIYPYLLLKLSPFKLNSLFK